jgi:hypothetical protein
MLEQGGLCLGIEAWRLFFVFYRWSEEIEADKMGRRGHLTTILSRCRWCTNVDGLPGETSDFIHYRSSPPSPRSNKILFFIVTSMMLERDPRHPMTLGKCPRLSSPSSPELGHKIYGNKRLFDTSREKAIPSALIFFIPGVFWFARDLHDGGNAYRWWTL